MSRSSLTRYDVCKEFPKFSPVTFILEFSSEGSISIRLAAS